MYNKRNLGKPQNSQYSQTSQYSQFQKKVL